MKIAIISVVVVILLVWLLLRAGPPLVLIQQRLQERLDELHAEHFQLAANSGKPRGLRWKHIEWEAEPKLAKERTSGLWIALLGATIQFEAIEGSDMEGLPAVNNLRVATGIFFYDRGDWHTSGRMIFNMTPDDVAQQFTETYESI